MRDITRKKFLFAVLFICILLIPACVKVNKVMMVVTGDVSNLKSNSAVVSGSVIDVGDGIIQYGHCWSTLPDPVIDEGSQKTQLGTISKPEVYTSGLNNILPGTTYYVKAYIKSANQTIYGEQVTFSTPDPVIPVITTTAVTSVTVTTAISGGNISDDGGAAITARGVCWSKNSNPTTNDAKTSDGSGKGTFTSYIAGLLPGQNYHVRAYASNSVGTSYGNDILFTTIASTQISDIDGNTYYTVTIGTQTWMDKNLMTSRYNDGTVIPEIADYSQWSGTKSQAFCWYSNNISNKQLMGAIYNGFVVFDSGGKNVCPVGWHVPSDQEWTTLTNYLGGESVSGDKLKEAGITNWPSSNTGATNETGFTALPGGERNPNGGFAGFGNEGFWWTSTPATSTASYFRSMDYRSTVTRSSIDKSLGYSIRCLKDN